MFSLLSVQTFTISVQRSFPRSLLTKLNSFNSREFAIHLFFYCTPDIVQERRFSKLNCFFSDLEEIRKFARHVLARIVVCNGQDFRVGVKLIKNDFCQQQGTVASH